MISKSTIKYIQSLQDKKNRDAHNVFIAEGPKLIKELIAQKIFLLDALYCTQKWHSNSAETIVNIDKNSIFVIEEFELEKISSLSIANQVLGVFIKKQVNVNPALQNKLTLVLEDVQDPGNLGTIIRTADWFGVENIICTPATADCFNPKVIQSTMASLGRVNIIYTDVISFIEKYPTIKKYSALLHGKNIKSFGNLQQGFIMLGNESKGLSEQLIKYTDEKITIAKIGEAESLNVAIAASIILHSITDSI